jgi:23S rRNA pseudouridine2605 synthase
MRYNNKPLCFNNGEMGKEPLIKLLAGTGIASRRRLADAIKKGRVAVNGEVAEDFDHPVDRVRDVVTIDREEVSIEIEQKVYIMLNKPAGVLSTARDERGRKTVIGLMPEQYRGYRLYTAGRLDKDSKGLGRLTNDGQLTQWKTHLGGEHEKEYYLYIKDKLTKEEMRRLENGICLEEGMT